jgi:hypothetical protein
MKKITYLALVFGAGICINSAALADEIQFTTLPQEVQTTVVRETHIANPTYVTRVVRDESGVYASSATTTTTTTTTVRQPAQTTTTEPAEGTVVTYDQVQQDLPRYQLLEKKGRKEVYLDRKTGQKVTVKREKD